MADFILIFQTLEYLGKSIKTGLNIYNEFKNLNTKEALNQMREKFLIAQENYYDLQQELLKLKDIEDLRKNYEFIPKKGIYIAKNPSKHGNHAFCPNCMVERKEAVPLSQTNPIEEERYRCEVCSWSGASKEANERQRRSLANTFSR